MIYIGWETYLNGVRDSCEKDRKTYYRKDGEGDFSLDLKKIISLATMSEENLMGFGTCGQLLIRAEQGPLLGRVVLGL